MKRSMPIVLFVLSKGFEVVVPVKEMKLTLVQIADSLRYACVTDMFHIL
jgi:hypothetical protein